jgi:hypothetical protein
MRFVELFEGLSPVLYHATHARNALDIVDNDRFRLTPDIGTSAETDHRTKEQNIYYMSFARSRTGQYHYPVSKYESGKAMLVVDGRALMADGYTGKSVDYWQMPGAKDEMEDRVFSDKSYITNATKYIREIHFLLTEVHGSDSYDKMNRVIRKAILSSRKKGIQVFVYDNPSDFNMLNKKNSKKLTQLTAVGPVDRTPGYTRMKNNYFAPYIELMNQPDYNKLSSDAKRKLSNMSAWNRSDGIRSLAADVHNARNSQNLRNDLDKFLAGLKKLNITNLSDFADWLEQRFKDQ